MKEVNRVRRAFCNLTWLLLAGSCFAQISGAPGGSCTGTTSCTLSAAPNSKSLQIAFAFRTATTAPSTPAGWTSVASANGTSSSYRVTCRVSATAASGTFTNATNVVIIWYGGTAANATANCNTTGINNKLATTAGASTTASYGGITVSHAYNRVVGFMGGSASSTCTPTGLTSIASTGTVLANDSGSNLASWATTTCSVTSENSITYVLEVMGAQDALSGPQPTIVPVDFYIDMQGNTTLANDTTTVCTSGTCTPMTNGTHSAGSFTWTANNSGTLTGILVSRQNVCPRNYDYYVRGDQIYPRTRPWRSMRIDHGNASGTGAVTGLVGELTPNSLSSSQGTMTGCLSIGAQACAGGQTLVDFIEFQGVSGRSSILQFDCGQGTNPASPGLKIESGLTGSTVLSNVVRVTPSKTYRFSFFADYVSGVQRAVIWDPYTLAIAGEMSLAQSVTPETINNVNFGNGEFYTNANCTGCQGNTYSYIEDVGVDFGGAYPIGPGWNDSMLWKSAATGTPGQASVFGIAVQ